MKQMNSTMNNFTTANDTLGVKKDKLPKPTIQKINFEQGEDTNVTATENAQDDAKAAQFAPYWNGDDFDYDNALNHIGETEVFNYLVNDMGLDRKEINSKISQSKFKKELSQPTVEHTQEQTVQEPTQQVGSETIEQVEPEGGQKFSVKETKPSTKLDTLSQRIFKNTGNINSESLKFFKNQARKFGIPEDEIDEHISNLKKIKSEKAAEIEGSEELTEKQIVNFTKLMKLYPDAKRTDFKNYLKQFGLSDKYADRIIDNAVFNINNERKAQGQEPYELKDYNLFQKITQEWKPNVTEEAREQRMNSSAPTIDDIYNLITQRSKPNVTEEAREKRLGKKYEGTISNVNYGTPVEDENLDPFGFFESPVYISYLDNSYSPDPVQMLKDIQELPSGQRPLGYEHFSYMVSPEDAYNYFEEAGLIRDNGKGGIEVDDDLLLMLSGSGERVKKLYDTIIGVVARKKRDGVKRNDPETEEFRNGILNSNAPKELKEEVLHIDSLPTEIDKANTEINIHSESASYCQEKIDELTAQLDNTSDNYERARIEQEIAGYQRLLEISKNKKITTAQALAAQNVANAEALKAGNFNKVFNSPIPLTILQAYKNGNFGDLNIPEEKEQAKQITAYLLADSIGTTLTNLASFLKGGSFGTQKSVFGNIRDKTLSADINAYSTGKTGITKQWLEQNNIVNEMEKSQLLDEYSRMLNATDNLYSRTLSDEDTKRTALNRVRTARQFASFIQPGDFYALCDLNFLLTGTTSLNNQLWALIDEFRYSGFSSVVSWIKDNFGIDIKKPFSSLGNAFNINVSGLDAANALPIPEPVQERAQEGIDQLPKEETTTVDGKEVKSQYSTAKTAENPIYSNAVNTQGFYNGVAQFAPNYLTGDVTDPIKKGSFTTLNDVSNFMDNITNFANQTVFAKGNISPDSSTVQYVKDMGVDAIVSYLENAYPALMKKAHAGKLPESGIKDANYLSDLKKIYNSIKSNNWNVDIDGFINELEDTITKIEKRIGNSKTGSIFYEMLKEGNLSDDVYNRLTRTNSTEEPKTLTNNKKLESGKQALANSMVTNKIPGGVNA